MKKKKIIGLASMAIALCLVMTVVYFYTAPSLPELEPVEEVLEPLEEINEPEEVSVAPVVPPIKKPEASSAPDVIPDPVVEEPVIPDVVETVTEEGEIHQSSNWEAQKELKEGTDLEDMDTKPEYKTPAPKTDTGSGAKNGDSKTIDGQEYKYVQGFGWVKDQGANVPVEVDAPTTGNKIGY